MKTYHLAAGAGGFGDGRHPTTACTLAALEAIDPAVFSPRLACDMGAGSGILSFAMYERFRCPVLAVDIARSAIEMLEENRQVNAVPARAAGSPTPGVLALVAPGFDHPTIRAEAPFDLIVMNILAEPLLALAAEAVALLAEDGVLILSGMLLWQEATLRAAYEGLGLALSLRLTQGDWVTLVWQREG